MTDRPTTANRARNRLVRRRFVVGEEGQREILIEEAAGCLDLSFSEEKDQELFLLCLIEAVNNAAEHGGRESPEGQVQVDLLLLPGLAGANVMDPGSGFQPTIPDLKTVTGSRGRGLGFIHQFCDVMFFNLRGNQITFFKGGEQMDLKLNHASATVSLLPKDTVVVSDFKVGSDLFNAVSELFDHIDQYNWRAIFFNLKEIKLFNSAAWGTIFAEADKPTSEQMVLFNAGDALLAASDAMGLTNPQGRFAAIRVLGPHQEVWRLLSERIAED